jgi:hypothetical protein
MAKPAQMPAGFSGWSLLDGERGSTTLKDLLHNLSIEENGGNHEYCKGLLVGVLAMLTASGMEFKDACQMVWQHMPRKVNRMRVPTVFHEHFADKLVDG